MTSEQAAYWEARAEQEIEAAQRSDDPRAVRAHYLLAGYYLDLVHNPEAEPPGELAPNGAFAPAHA